MKQPTINFDLLNRIATQTRAFRAGETIFREGDAGTELFVIREGSVEVRLGDRVLETLGPDEILGEMALLERQARSATAVAMTDCVVVPVSEKQFLVLIRIDPHFALGLMRALAQRLRVANRGSGSANPLM